MAQNGPDVKPAGQVSFFITKFSVGKRNDSISFSQQPFINKMGGAVASGIIGAVVILSGIKDAKTAADVTPERIVDDLARRRELNLE